MTELLPKEEDCLSSVSKNAAAIFLLIIMMFIGSIPTALANGMIAAETPNTIASILDLPKPLVVSSPVFNVPTLTKTPMFWEPEMFEDNNPSDTSYIPVLKGTITSNYGWRKHPVKGKVRHHNGLDIAAKLGTPVLAPASGTVIFSGMKRGYGNVVEIDHGNGYVSLLAHHSKLLVKTGDVVDTHTIIARAGRTGVATGVHVHVEIRHNGSLLNPRIFLNK